MMRYAQLTASLGFPLQIAGTTALAPRSCAAIVAAAQPGRGSEWVSPTKTNGAVAARTAAARAAGSGSSDSTSTTLARANSASSGSANDPPEGTATTSS